MFMQKFIQFNCSGLGVIVLTGKNFVTMPKTIPPSYLQLVIKYSTTKGRST